MNQMQNAEQLGQDKISKLLLRFSIPAVIGMVVQSIYNIVEQKSQGYRPSGRGCHRWSGYLERLGPGCRYGADLLIRYAGEFIRVLTMS